MSYLEAVTPSFREVCDALGLVKAGRVGMKRTYRVGFAVEVPKYSFEQALSAADSYADLMVCWKWAPRSRESAVIERLKQLKDQGRLHAEQEYAVWLMTPVEDLWDLSPEAQLHQKDSTTKARLRSR